MRVQVGPAAAIEDDLRAPARAPLKSHIKNGFFMNWSGMLQGEGVEFHILALGIAVALLFSGGGAWSLDRLLWRRLSRRLPGVHSTATT